MTKNMVDVASSPTLNRKLVGEMDIVVDGYGPFLETKDGRVLFDFAGGPCVASLGYSSKIIRNAISEQNSELNYAYSGMHFTDVSLEAGDEVKWQFDQTWPYWFGKVTFPCSGNEAVEWACRIAAQYWLELGRTKTVIAARDYAFHGTSLLTSALSDDFGRYEMMFPWYDDARSAYVLRVPGYPDNNVDDSSILQRTKDLLFDSIHNGNPVAALIVEPMGGPPVGCTVPSREYLQGLRDICDKLHVLLIFDELLCGCGRVGVFTVGQYFDVKPDIVILGKGLTSGYVPLSAVVLSQKIVDVLTKGSGVALVGTTYANHTLGCAAAAASLRFLRESRIISHVKTHGAWLKKILNDNLDAVDIVYDIRGLGYLYGIELRDPQGNYFPSNLAVHQQVKEALYNAGIIVYSKGQTIRINGEFVGDFIVLAPYFLTDTNVLNEQLKKLADVLTNFGRTISNV